MMCVLCLKLCRHWFFHFDKTLFYLESYVNSIYTMSSKTVVCKLRGNIRQIKASVQSRNSKATDGQDISGADRRGKTGLLWKSICWRLEKALRELDILSLAGFPSKARGSHLSEKLLWLTLRSRRRRGCGFSPYLREVNVSDTDEILSRLFLGCLQLVWSNPTSRMNEDMTQDRSDVLGQHKCTFKRFLLFRR